MIIIKALGESFVKRILIAVIILIVLLSMTACADQSQTEAAKVILQDDQLRQQLTDSPEQPDSGSKPSTAIIGGSHIENTNSHVKNNDTILLTPATTSDSGSSIDEQKFEVQMNEEPDILDDNPYIDYPCVADEWRYPLPTEQLTIERAAELYSRFLEDEIASTDGLWVSTFYDSEIIKDIFMVRDITGDGIPEIYQSSPGVAGAIWSIENGQVVHVASLGSYLTLLANGGIFYQWSDGVPHHDEYWYMGLSPESKEFPDVDFGIYPADEALGLKETCFIGGEEVSREEWQAVADIYFALRDMEPDEAQRAVSFSEWIASLDVSIEPSPFSEEKASRIFAQFLTSRTVGYDLDGNTVIADYWYSDYDLKGMTQFLVWDFTGDGIPEVYLPVFSRDVWTIRDNHQVVLLGKLDDMDNMPENPISFLEWLVW